MTNKTQDAIEEALETLRLGVIDQTVEHEEGYTELTWLGIKYKKSLTKLQTLLDGDQWQPIETAPKNERILILSSAYGVPKVYVARLINGRFKGEGRIFNKYSSPTHWRPLPKPPITSKMVVSEYRGFTFVEPAHEESEEFTYASTADLSKALGFSDDKADQHERGVNAALRRGKIKVIEESED